MEQQYKNFFMTLYKFITDLNRYKPTEGTNKVIDVLDKLDVSKVIKRTCLYLKDKMEKINSKDESLFQQEVLILPGVNISEVWNDLIKGQKDKIWLYLKMLYIQAEIIYNIESQSQNNTTKNTEQNINEDKATRMEENTKALPMQDNDKKETSFNPYIGVGNNDLNGKKYGIDEMFSNLPEDNGKSSAPGFETLIDLIGVNKFINLEELMEQLKNMKPEDIESATNNIKNMLGSNIDDKTSNLISDMLNDIQEELIKNDMSGSDPMKKIYNIATVVSEKMKPKLQQENIDVTQLFNTTQTFADKCVDKDGKPLFGEGMNPLKMLGQFTNLLSSNEKIDPNNPEVKNINNQIGQYQNMLKNMGINLPGGMNLNNLNNMNRNTKKNPKKKAEKK